MGKIILEAADQNVILEYPRYNMLRQLHSTFNIEIPGITDKKVYCSMTLQRDHNKFSGYIFYQQSREHSDYTMPLFVEVNKE